MFSTQSKNTCKDPGCERVIIMMVGDLRGGSAELEMEWWRARSRGLRALHTADPGLLPTSLPSLVLLLKARDAGTGRGGAGPGVVVWVL